MFDDYIKVYGPRIHRLATRLACGDPDLLDDLEQEGRIALWHFDSATIRTNASAIIMRVVRDAMLQYRRRERAAHAGPPHRPSRRARRHPSLVTEHAIPPQRRNVPRHRDATPVTEPLAA